jgi:DNA-binding transcriptional ArsR family regulator
MSGRLDVSTPVEAIPSGVRYDRPMKLGPDIAGVAALIGDPARANMLTALLSGRALTAGELAREAGVTLQTASFHIGKLEAGGLVAAVRQGRHRYVSLAGPEVAEALEALTGLAARGPGRVRTGPKEPALRRARLCWDHLAGELGVLMFDRLVGDGALLHAGERVVLTGVGERRVASLGVATEGLARGARPLCRACLDWSERRPHLGGPLGRALAGRFLELGWMSREPGSRVVRFGDAGERAFRAWLS